MSVVSNFNGSRIHLEASGCFWDESELQVCMGVSIINEIVMGSAGSLKRKRKGVAGHRLDICMVTVESWPEPLIEHLGKGPS